MSENGWHRVGLSLTYEPFRQRQQLGQAAPKVNIVKKPEAQSFSYTVIDSPVGPLRLVASDAGLVAILWQNDNPRRVRLGTLAERNEHPVLREAGQQLSEYFAGRRKAFTLKLDSAGTPFQRRVWAALLTIPYGETRSYGQIARQLGCPSAVRAVGAANGKNPISIMVPCHRVVGSTGKLTGFAGGLDAKAYLLSLEARHPDLRRRECEMKRLPQCGA
jgi:methylated-DNA-[protein]-cysteine S-methyltransferase